MCFVNDHEIPRDSVNVAGLRTRELVGADDHRIALERPESPLTYGFVIRLGFQDAAREEKLLRKLLVPLLAQIGRRNNEHAAPALRPLLRDHEAHLDGLAQAHLVGKDRALRKRRAEGEKRRLNLMRVQVHLHVHQRARKLFHTVRRAAQRQLMGEEFRVVRS